MIDVGLMNLIRQVLEVSTADVNEAREALLVEQRSADARYAASSALVHPEGSTTPINEAYSRAQDRVADLRAKALRELPAAFKLLLALQVAEERRAEALKHRDMKWDQVFAKDALGVHPAVADWFARLHNHGVHPHHLKQQAAEMVAIIADLITWKAKDAKFRDPNNPWRAVLQVYASRRIDKPLSKRSKAKRSVPGSPTRNRHISDLGDYMFNEMVPGDSSWQATTDQVEVESTPTDADPIDAGGSSPTALSEEEAVMPVEPVAMHTKEDDHAENRAADEQASAEDADADEYALPDRIDADTRQRIFVAARQFVASDPDWDLDLQAATRWFHGSLTTAEIIERVESTPDPAGATPFRHFVKAARAGGLEAGRQSYHAATVRRIMFEIVTAPGYEVARANLRLA